MQNMFTRARVWVEDRTGLETAGRRFLFEEIPASSGWPQVFGGITLFLFLTQSLTGILLALNYAATPGDAYDSVNYILHQVAGGRIVHGLHHWGASWMIVCVFLHMAQVFIYGAFRKPREATWIAGVALLLLTLTFALTGYLLPWDNKAYWGTMVTTKIIAGLPVAGPILTRLLGATNGIGVVTFSRFYALHTLLLPAMTAVLIAIHVYLVRRHGVTPSPSEKAEKQRFYPRQVFRDVVAVFVVFLSLFLAAAVVNTPLERMADATDSTYVPRPEWYFLFLFQLLKIFPGRLELIGTAVLPGIAVAALTILPFLHRTHRRFLNGKTQATCAVILVFAIWAGLTGSAGSSPSAVKRTLAVSEDASTWAKIPPRQIAGFTYFRSLHCDSCHNLIAGNPKQGPDLGSAGVRHAKDWMLEHFSEQATPPAGESGGSENVNASQANALLAFIGNLQPAPVRTLAGMPQKFLSGANTFVAHACESCHKVDGEGGALAHRSTGLRSAGARIGSNSILFRPRGCRRVLSCLRISFQPKKKTR